MIHSEKLITVLILSGLCTQCVTSKVGIKLSSDVTIGCKSISIDSSRGMSEVECLLENHGNVPARIKFEKVSLDDPQSDILPVDVTTVPKGQTLENIVVVLGVVVVLGALIALATKSKTSYIPSVHVSVPYTPPRQTLTAPVGSRSKPFLDTIEIPAYRHAILVFKAKHGLSVPTTLVLQLDSNVDPLRVPIEAPFGKRKGRSDFDH